MEQIVCGDKTNIYIVLTNNYEGVFCESQRSFATHNVTINVCMY